MRLRALQRHHGRDGRRQPAAEVPGLTRLRLKLLHLLLLMLVRLLLRKESLLLLMKGVLRGARSTKGQGGDGGEPVRHDQ